MKILITGMAGFIGYSLADLLSKEGHEVMGFDNYCVDELKHARVKKLWDDHEIITEHIDLNDFIILNSMIREQRPDVVVHLAGHAGIRDSLDNPQAYHLANIDGTQNLIGSCTANEIQKVLYASTSSLMSGNDIKPWIESEPNKHMLNPYSYTKFVNECQFKMSTIPNTIGMRFFTVYGPWGRPDMALFKFTKNISEDEPITVYNDGNMKRDFTFISDILDGIKILLFSDIPGHEIFNIGNGKQIELMEFIRLIEKNLGRQAIIDYHPIHPADSQETWSDTRKLSEYGYKPKVNIEEGVERFVSWYKHFYEIN